MPCDSCDIKCSMRDCHVGNLHATKRMALFLSQADPTVSTIDGLDQMGTNMMVRSARGWKYRKHP